MRWNNGKVLRVTQLVFIKLTIPLTSLNVSQILSIDWQIWKSQLRRKRRLFEPSLCESVTPFFISDSNTSWPRICGCSDADEALSWSPGLFLGTPAGTPCAPSPVPLPACQLSPLFSFPFSYPRPPLSLSLSLLMPCLGILLWYQLVEVLHLFTKKTFSETLDSTMSHEVGGKVTIRLDIEPLIPDLFDSPVFILPVVPGNID